MFCIPIKYPRSTAESATNIIAGDKAIKVYFTPGLLKNLSAINPDPKKSIKANITAVSEKSPSATLNILCAPLLSPIAIFSDTNFEMVFGIPIVAIARINV